VSITTTCGPLNPFKRGINGFITLLLWSLRTPPKPSLRTPWALGVHGHRLRTYALCKLMLSLKQSNKSDLKLFCHFTFQETCLRIYYLGVSLASYLSVLNYVCDWTFSQSGTWCHKYSRIITTVKYLIFLSGPTMWVLETINSWSYMWPWSKLGRISNSNENNSKFNRKSQIRPSLL